MGTTKVVLQCRFEGSKEDPLETEDNTGITFEMEEAEAATVKVELAAGYEGEAAAGTSSKIHFLQVGKDAL